jgi:hypothetical protein
MKTLERLVLRSLLYRRLALACPYSRNVESEKERRLEMTEAGSCTVYFTQIKAKAPLRAVQ